MCIEKRSTISSADMKAILDTLHTRLDAQNGSNTSAEARKVGANAIKAENEQYSYERSTFALECRVLLAGCIAND